MDWVSRLDVVDLRREAGMIKIGGTDASQLLLTIATGRPESLQGKPWYRSNFRQRLWRPAWDEVDVDNPSSKRHRPAVLSGFTFHEGMHTHATW
jgi:hypothetical protein